jgi:hypothetical protein
MPNHYISPPGRRLIHPSQLFRAGDTGDVTPATAANDPVRLMKGQRGSFNFTGASDAARPLLKFDGPVAYLLFDGTDDLLTAGTTSDWKYLHNGTGGSLAAVMQSGVTNTHLLFGTGNSGSGAHLRRTVIDTPSCRVLATGTDVIPASTTGWSLGVNAAFPSGLTYATRPGFGFRLYGRGGVERLAVESSTPDNAASAVGLRIPLTVNTATCRFYAGLAISREISDAEMLGLFNYWRSIAIYR